MIKVRTDNAPAASGPYSQAIRTGNLIFVSGQLPIDPATGEMVRTNVKDATRQSLKNMQAVLEAAGSGLDQVVKTTCLLDDVNDFADFNEVYEEFFSHKPARSCFAVKDIPKKSLVEIECIAIAQEEAEQDF